MAASGRTVNAAALRELERLEWVTSRAHRDAGARWRLLRSWFAGQHASWRAAAQYLLPGQRVAPLAVPDAACPGAVACRHPPAVRHPPAQRTPRRALLRARAAVAPHRGRAGYVCPALSSMASHAQCVAALVSLRLLAPRLVVVGRGIDTLELHTKRPVGPHTGQRIEATFDRAAATKEPQRFELAGVEFEVQPRMVKGGWLLRNASSDVVLRVRPQAEVDEASVVVELHAACLWARGWRDSAELARRLCEAVTGSSDVDLQVTRLDLCMDFQGWCPTPEDRGLFVTRAKKRARFHEGHVEPQWDSPAWLDREAARVERLAKQLARADSLEERQRLLEVLHRPPEERATCVEYEAGRLAFTGFAFGMGHHLGARLYNKTRECRRSRKGWFHEVWAKAPDYRRPPGGTVNGQVRAHFDTWRLEFQLRREALREFTFNAEGGWLDLSAWDDCAEHIDELWGYLTRHWLRHGWRTAGERVQLSAPWKVLNRARLAESGQAVESLERHIPEVGVLPTLGAVAGYVSTAAAQLQELATPGELTASADYGALMAQVLLAAQKHAEERQPLAERIEEKRGKLRQRRAFLAKRSTVRDDRRREAAQKAQRFGEVDGLLVRWTEEEDRKQALSAVRRAEHARQAYEQAAATLPF